MKFRLKVLVCNLILTSLVFSIGGYFLIQYNYRLILDREIENAMTQNQLVHVAVESECVNMILTDKYEGKTSLADVGETVAKSLDGTDAYFVMLTDNSDIVYQVEGEVGKTDLSYYLTTDLLNNLEAGSKNYIINREGDEYYELAVSSSFMIDEETVYIINQQDISEVYSQRRQQIDFLRILTLAAMLICAVLMYLISYFLTRPIGKLKKTTERMTAGEYSARANIRTSDEIGDLGNAFNVMSESIETNVDMLKEENRKRNEFVANFTHEMKTPMTSVIGYADMLRSKNMDKEQQVMAANYIFNEGMRLETMSRKLFDLFLLSKEEIVKGSIYVPELLRSIAESVKPMLDEAGIKLRVRTQKIKMTGDSDLLKSALINIIDNARKASDKGQTILLQAYKKKGRVIIEVCDQGRGIPQEDISKITEAFYMVDKSRSREEGGAGLGLSLAAVILDKHHAKLKIISKVGSGTAMRIFFPRGGAS